ncbi:MAG: type II toxin-antitoxin system HicA family toxin [Actinomycetia bacterium]|nr:type II toxin-antitoxin system HicA family toxin [Actinomycetes bacterium]
MKSREVLKRIQRSRCCAVLRQRGSHKFVRCECEGSNCTTVVPAHAGVDLGRGLLRAVERDLEPCLEERWLKRT